MTEVRQFTVALVGAGNMGGAMLAGWLEAGVPPANITVFDPAPPPPMAALIAQSGIVHKTEATDAAAADLVVLAVKPQIFDTVLPGVRNLFGPRSVAVSVAAGKTIASMQAHLGDIACIRAMPNTPALIRQGMTVACPNARVTDEQRSNADFLLAAIGAISWVEDESLIDAVTAVSGSGPAYVFHLAECMAAAGVECGLPEDLSMLLAKQTIAGAGALMLQSADDPAQLRKNVTSPNGTTAAALDVLMAKDGLQAVMSKAIAAARKRSEELSG